MKRYADIIKTSRDSSDRGDKHTNPNNSAALMGLKNVSTDIIVSRDSGDIKTEDGAKINCNDKCFVGRLRWRCCNFYDNSD